MSDIALLTKEEEVALASEIAELKNELRALVLTTRYGFREAERLLDKARTGKLFYDRVIKEENKAKRKETVARLEGHLKELETIFEANNKDSAAFRVQSKKRIAERVARALEIFAEYEIDVALLVRWKMRLEEHLRQILRAKINLKMLARQPASTEWCAAE
jgi:hypothetical protein